MKLAVRDSVLEAMSEKLMTETVSRYDAEDKGSGSSDAGAEVFAETAKLDIDEVKDLITENLD